jgi:hypothetical protein
MDLDRKFQDVSSCHSVKISSLEVDCKYPITHTESIVTKFGPTVLLSIRYISFRTVKVFMPKRYGSVFSDADIEDINIEMCYYISFTKEYVIKLYYTSWPRKNRWLCTTCIFMIKLWMYYLQTWRSVGINCHITIAFICQLLQLHKIVIIKKLLTLFFVSF